VFHLARRSSISRPPHAESFRRAVHRYLDGGDWQLVEEFVEAESGKQAIDPSCRRRLRPVARLALLLVLRSAEESSSTSRSRLLSGYDRSWRGVSNVHVESSVRADTWISARPTDLERFVEVALGRRHVTFVV
jgi:hypothetical protein